MTITHRGRCFCLHWGFSSPWNLQVSIEVWCGCRWCSGGLAVVVWQRPSPHRGGHRTGVLGEILKLCFASEISSLFLFKELVVATFPKHQRWTVWFKITQVKTVPERCIMDCGNLFALSWVPAFCSTLFLVSVFWSWSVSGIRMCVCSHSTSWSIAWNWI